MTDFPFSDVDFSAEDIVNREVIPHSKALTERSLARRLALQALYELDSTDHNLATVLAHFLSNDREAMSFHSIIDVTDSEEIINNVSDIIETHIVREEEEHRVIGYFMDVVKSVFDWRAEYDKVLHTFADEFPFDQVSIIDRNILRIALYELITQSQIPTGVVIDEAMELARLFGSEGTPFFINGVLGALSKNLAEIQEEMKDVLNNSDS
jgi:transcription antitermination protein NusB